ncbi:MAG TPA: M20/M25/M40 family metallo-hydrolase [Roseimicrobium sp.]|nr:M20/M25/M40 family metallo-hydrolase [Roseimicrobium sp.]
MTVPLLQHYLERRLPDALEILRQMVEINSWTENRDGVNRLAKLTSQVFARLGFSAESVPSAQSRWGDHLVLTRKGNGPRSIAFVSHLDTVFPPEEEIRNAFRWSVEGDRIYGPGTNDIKGGTVMMWLVLEALKESDPVLFELVTWRLFLNSSEENYSPDFGQLIRSRLEPDALAALVFESEGRLGEERLMVVARKGRASFRVRVEGRASHAGSSHASGANAIVQLARTVEQIAAITDYAAEVTVNVGTISGGTVLNRVPHEAVAEGELRAFTPEAYNCAIGRLKSLAGEGTVRSITDKHPCRISIEILTETRPWPANAGSDSLFRHWEAAGKEYGVLIGSQERGGLSDGNLIWDHVPTLDGLGPSGEFSHCSERSADGSKVPEYVDLPSFVPKALVNVNAIRRLLKA